MITVGIVDDHQLFSSSLSIMLENFQKYKVVVDAVNGKDLQLKISSLPQHPDLLLIDVNMPVMDGYEFLQQLRRMPGGSKPKVVFCTTENDVSQIARAMHAGADEYIMKPFDRQIVRSKFEEIGLI